MSMLRTFHAARRLRAAAESSRQQIRRQLCSRQLASIEASLLRRLEFSAGGGGSKPLILLENPKKVRYLLKVADPDLMAAEVAADELRQLGGRPSVPARIFELTLEDLGTITGVLKPYIDFDPSRELLPDTTTWTPLQRAVILSEHAWEWFLDNLDTNTGQYVLFGADGIPVNFDWDRSFCTEGHAELSRFVKYKKTIPSARTFLYADYVEGRIDLPFDLLLAEARHIRALPAARVRAALERYAAVRFEDPQAREEFVVRMLARQRRIDLSFRRFVRELMNERRGLSRQDLGLRGQLWAKSVALWNRWQLLLHYISRGPVGSLGRALLRFLRGRRHLSHKPDPSAKQDLPEPEALPEASLQRTR